MTFDQVTYRKLHKITAYPRMASNEAFFFGNLEVFVKCWFAQLLDAPRSELERYNIATLVESEIN